MSKLFNNLWTFNVHKNNKVKTTQETLGSARFVANRHSGSFFRTYLDSRVKGGLYEYNAEMGYFKFPCGSLCEYKIQNLTDDDIVVDIQGPNGSSFIGILLKRERYGYNLIGLNKDTRTFERYGDAFMSLIADALHKPEVTLALYYDANFKEWVGIDTSLQCLLSDFRVMRGDARG